jgi:hypothetical protein
MEKLSSAARQIPVSSSALKKAKNLKLIVFPAKFIGISAPNAFLAIFPIAASSQKHHIVCRINHDTPQKPITISESCLTQRGVC